MAKVVLSAAAPPNTPAAMLTAAETAETELSKKTTPGASALAVEVEPEVKTTKEDGAPATPLMDKVCLLYTSPSPRDRQKSRMPSSA